MGLSKVEVNLRRLLEAAPRQQNQAKLVHYITTARGLLEQLGAESTPEGLSSVSKAKPSGYSEMIEALAATLFAPPESENLADEIREDSCQGDQIRSAITLSSELRRRSTAHLEIEPSSHDRKQRYVAKPIKLDVDAQTHIEKQRELQEDLTDEMVELAHQLKESSLLMGRSVQETEKILDSTERAVEHSFGKHQSCDRASIGGILAGFQDRLRPVAAHLHDDLHVCYGSSTHTDHLMSPLPLRPCIPETVLTCT